MPLARKNAYELCKKRIIALCEDETDEIARMSSIVCILYHEMAGFFWVGFYRVVGEELVIGPYQGTMGCLRIPFGKGVCGMAAQSGRTQVVRDVNEFPGHIACDDRSRSEIVIPVRNSKGELIAVLDIDSEQVAMFGKVDRDALEEMMRLFAAD